MLARKLVSRWEPESHVVTWMSYAHQGAQNGERMSPSLLGFRPRDSFMRCSWGHLGGLVGPSWLLVKPLVLPLPRAPQTIEGLLGPSLQSGASLGSTD